MRFVPCPAVVTAELEHFWQWLSFVGSPEAQIKINKKVLPEAEGRKEELLPGIWTRKEDGNCIEFPVCS